MSIYFLFVIIFSSISTEIEVNARISKLLLKRCHLHKSQDWICSEIKRLSIINEQT